MARNYDNTIIELECEEERENGLNEIVNEGDNEDTSSTLKSDCHW
jgi:hypothetical protein